MEPEVQAARMGSGSDQQRSVPVWIGYGLLLVLAWFALAAVGLVIALYEALIWLIGLIRSHGFGTGGPGNGPGNGPPTPTGSNGGSTGGGPEGSGSAPEKNGVAATSGQAEEERESATTESVEPSPGNEGSDSESGGEATPPSTRENGREPEDSGKPAAPQPREEDTQPGSRTEPDEGADKKRSQASRKASTGKRSGRRGIRSNPNLDNPE